MPSPKSCPDSQRFSCPHRSGATHASHFYSFASGAARFALRDFSSGGKRWRNALFGARLDCARKLSHDSEARGRRHAPTAQPGSAGKFLPPRCRCPFSFRGGCLWGERSGRRNDWNGIGRSHRGRNAFASMAAKSLSRTKLPQSSGECPAWSMLQGKPTGFIRSIN